MLTAGRYDSFVTTSAGVPLRASLATAVERALGAHPATIVQDDDRRKAAVLLLLYERDGEPWTVLTKRTDTVATHKGQISFPGGGHDPEDEDMWATAVRETHEELGVEPARLARLGALDDHATFGSSFVVSPFIAALDPPGRWVPSAAEIDAVIEVPVRRLMEIARVEEWDRYGTKIAMHIFDVDEHRVWGLTAFILKKFLDVAGSALLGEGAVDAAG
jgi:8-oxo-dGTP pyrophosphatase MutT (NUDIX family)